MATEAVKSSGITNADASPVVFNNPGISAPGRLHSQMGYAAVANGVTAGSTYRLARINSSDRVADVAILNAGIATTGAVDIGLYKTAADGGAVVDADFFASAVLLTTDRTAWGSVRTEAAAAGGLITNLEKRVWEALGLSADPGIMYDVVMTSTATMGAAGTVALRIDTFN